MNRDDILDMLEDGTIATVEFIKKDGSLRTLNGRLNVKKHLKGGTKAFDDADKGLITIYDLKNKGYRSFKVENLRKLKVKGQEYNFA